MRSLTPFKSQSLFFALLLISGVFLWMPAQPVLANTCQAGETVHVIKSGENLYRIGLRYGIPFERIASRNNIADVTRIYAGMTLCIPAGGSPSYSPPAQPPASPPKTTHPPSTTVQSGKENWCLNGGPWDDGRCIVPGNPYQQNYWFYAGWCNAQIQLQNYKDSFDNCMSQIFGVTSASGSTNTIKTTVTTFNFSLVNSTDEFACTIIYDKYTGTVTSLARWKTAYDDQDQVIFFTNLPNLDAYAVMLNATDTRAGKVMYTDLYKTFAWASASIKVRDDEGNVTMTVGPVDCDRIG